MKYKIIKLPNGKYIARYKRWFWHTLQEYIGDSLDGFYQNKKFQTMESAKEEVIELIGCVQKAKDIAKKHKVLVLEGDV